MMHKMIRAAVLVAGAAFAQQSLAAQCDANFTNEGSFFKGHTFKTTATLKGAPNDVFKAVYQQVVKEGWTISQADKELGSITATQTVSYGNGKTAPLNAMVESAGSGSKVSFVFQLSGGTSSPEEAVKKGFCTLLSTAGPEA
jgi:hypothetical protein